MKNLLIEESKCEEILASLDGVKRAEAPAFLYGKIQARLNTIEYNFLEKIKNTIARPAVTISFVISIPLLDFAVVEWKVKNTSINDKDPNYHISIEDNFEELVLYGLRDNEYAYFFQNY